MEPYKDRCAEKAKTSFYTKNRRDEYDELGFCVAGSNTNPKKKCEGTLGEGCLGGDFCFLCVDYRRTDVWMVSIRKDKEVENMEQNDEHIENVKTALREMGIGVHDKSESKGNNSRRRLSPGEKYLHRLRQTTSYRDPPVL